MLSFGLYLMVWYPVTLHIHWNGDFLSELEWETPQKLMYSDFLMKNGQFCYNVPMHTNE